MSVLPWEAQLCQLIRKWRIESSASLRHEYRSKVLAAVQQNMISKPEADLLLRARSVLEQWIDRSPPSPPEALAQWKELGGEASVRLPQSIQNSLLKRFPRGKDTAKLWTPLLLEQEREIVDVILDTRLVTPAELTKLAKHQPRELYHSYALDRALDSRMIRCPPELWKVLADSSDRGTLPMAWEAVVVRCYLTDPAPAANKRVLELLIDHPEIRPRLLSELQRDSEAAIRFCRFITLDHRPKGKDRDATEGVVREWIETSEGFLSTPGEVGVCASVVYGFTRFASVISRILRQPERFSAAVAAASGVLKSEMTKTLRREEEFGLAGESRLFALTPAEMYDAAQEYMRTLPSSSSIEDGLDRRAMLERFRGRREVLLHVLNALDSTEDDRDLRASLEVALFNSGVRPLGAVGDTVTFVSQSHEPARTSILPGETARISKPGRVLGNGDDSIVLSKAYVIP